MLGVFDAQITSDSRIVLLHFHSWFALHDQTCSAFEESLLQITACVVVEFAG